MVLHDEQQYVFDIADTLGIDAKMVHHDVATVTCKEKADLLGWPLEQVVKAVYFRSQGHVVGIITPELGRIDIETILSEALDIPVKKARTYVPSFIPSGMMRGTCTPFPYESSMLFSEVNKLVVYDCQSIDDKLVDISVGGCDESSLKTSMHLPYGAIYDILKSKFDDSVVKYIPREVNEYERSFSRGV